MKEMSHILAEAKTTAVWILANKKQLPTDEYNACTIFLIVVAWLQDEGQQTFIDYYKERFQDAEV